MRPSTSRLADVLLSVLFAMTFILAGGEKLVEPGAPSWFLEQFSGTLIDLFPGCLPVTYFAIAVAEVAVGVACALAIVPRLAFLRELGLLGALGVFTMLAFGQRLTHQFEDAALLTLLAMGTYLVFRARPIRPSEAAS